MYTPGKLIYFDPFYFKDGTSKPKYFLVLKIDSNNNIILASMPSSVTHLPPNQVVVHGCLELPEICMNCYVFKANRQITKSGWSFEFNTYLYGFWLDDFRLEELQSNYQIEHVDFEIIGELSDEELSKVIDCFVNSSVVKRRYRRILSNN